MKKDFSTIPANKVITNNSDELVKFDLRDIIFQVQIVIEPHSSIVVTAKSSDGLAILYKKADELGLVVTDSEVPPTPEEPVEVSDIDSLNKAIAENKKEIVLTNNITVSGGKLVLGKTKHFKGNGNTITFDTVGQNLVSTNSGCVIENVVINNTAADENWSSTYGIQCYNGEYTVKDCTVSGCNAGILANSANVTLEGNINVSNNAFGGIEVSKGKAGTVEPVLNINGATITNTTEAYGKPTIWIDGQGTVNGAEAMFANSEVKEGQIQYYLVEENSTPDGILVNGVVYNTLSSAINAIPDNTETEVTLYKDEIVTSSVEIPTGKKVVLDLNGHTISGSDFSANGRILTNKGELTITGDGTITGEALGTKGTGAINNEGTLTVESGTFKGGQEANGACVNNKTGATMTVNGGTFNGCPRGIQNLATLTINDGTFIGSDTYSGNEGNGVMCGPSSNTTVKGGTFIGHMNGISVMDNAEATLKIEGGTFKTDGYENSGAIYNGLGNTITIDNCQAITEGNSGCTFVNKGIATVNGGTFQGDNTNAQVYTVDSGQGASSKASIELGQNVSAYGTFGALRVTSGTANVKGGTYTVNADENSTPYYALYVSSSSGETHVTVEDGTFNSDNVCVRCGEKLYSKNCDITINGGTFISPEGIECVAQETPGSVTIKGGTYSSDIENFIPEGYVVNEVEGKFVVSAT